MTDFPSAFSSVPIVGILRGVPKRSVLSVVNASFDGGLKCIEITLNTPGAPDLIAMAVKERRPDVFIGAGTVLTREACEQAIDAGARFIVAPNTNADVIAVCKKRSIPVFPGALTPTEIFSAWNAGAFMVKVFPVSTLGGPAYIKELRGPFGSGGILACGGVTLENLHAYFAAGANGIAIGGGIFKAEWMEGDFGKIREKAREFADAVNRQTKIIATIRQNVSLQKTPILRHQR